VSGTSACSLCESSSTPLTTTFGARVSVADASALYIWDSCFHCGSYSQYYLTLTNNNAKSQLSVLASLEVISPVAITSSTQPKTIGSESGSGVYTFKVPNFDDTTAQVISVNVTGGAVSVALFRKTLSPFGNPNACFSSPEYAPLWHKWCVSGTPCQYLYTQANNDFGYSSLNTIDTLYGVVIGVGTVTVKLLTFTATTAAPTSSQAPFCSSVGFPQSYLSYGNPQYQDNYASQIYTAAEAAVTNYDPSLLSSSCSSSIKTLACGFAFPQADSSGFSSGYGTSHTDCWDTYTSCGVNVATLPGLSALSCSRGQYTGANNVPTPPTNGFSTSSLSLGPRGHVELWLLIFGVVLAIFN